MALALTTTAGIRKGPPIVNRDPASEYKMAKIEAGNELTSGVLFIKHMDFYLSLSEWVLLLPMKRIDKYLGFLEGLTVNLRLVIHKNSATSDIIKTEVNSMLDAISLLKRGLMDSSSPSISLGVDVTSQIDACRW